MRIVAFSDSHGNSHVLRRIVAARPDADVFIHLGDGERELDNLAMEFTDKRFYFVCGNCDMYSMAKTQDLIELAGKKIFFTHGHIYGVKSDLDKLKHEAKAAGADIVLFGHTHIAMTEYDSPIYYMNPGSVTRPQKGPISYGVVDITGAGIVTFISPL